MRWALLLTLLIILLVSAILGQSKSLLLLLLPLIFVLAVGVLQSAETVHLTVARALSETTLQVGQPLTITLTLSNHGAALTELHIIDALTPRLTLSDGTNQRIISLKAGAQFDLRYSVTGRRGFYRLPFVELIHFDMFGLVKQRYKLNVTGESMFQIAPQYEKIADIVIRPKNTRSFAGYIPARIPGSGIDFFGVREYRPGDSLRHINWRAVSRAPDTIFTNEFEQERVADVGLILDARKRAVTFAQDTAILEHKISALSAFSASLLNAGNRVSMLIYGNYLNWTLPGYGKHQQQRIIHSLTATTEGNSEVFSTLHHLPTWLFPPKSQLIIFSTLLPEDLPALQRIRSRGYSVLIISPNPVKFEQACLAQTTQVQVAARILQIKRQALMQQIRQIGVQVVDWDVETPLKQVVSAQLQRPPLPQPVAYF